MPKSNDEESKSNDDVLTASFKKINVLFYNLCRFPWLSFFFAGSKQKKKWKMCLNSKHPNNYTWRQVFIVNFQQIY